MYYLNDLPLQRTLKLNSEDSGKSSGKEFVDDISVLSKAATIPKLLIQVQNDYTKIHNYLVGHKMCINPDKSQLMVLMPPEDTSELNISINSNIIKHQNEIKILGVTLSANMKFDSHIWAGKSSMAKSLNGKIALIKTIKPFISQKALGQVAASLVNSSILYAAPIWGATTQANIQKIQSLQIRAARLVKNNSWQRTKKKQHRQELLNELNWPNTSQIIYSASLNLAKKAVTNSSSASLNKVFKVSKPNKARSQPVITTKEKTQNLETYSHLTHHTCSIAYLMS